MSRRRAKRRGGALSVSIIVIAFLVVMVVQVVQSAKIYVDGKEIDYTSPVEITYGKHTLKVTADGYDTWTRTLYVNSKEATIQITINDNADSTGTNSTATAQTPSETASERADEKDNQSTSQRQSVDFFLFLLLSQIPRKYRIQLTGSSHLSLTPLQQHL